MQTGIWINLAPIDTLQASDEKDIGTNITPTWRPINPDEIGRRPCELIYPHNPACRRYVCCDENNKCE